MSAITSPALRYHGSKFRLAPWLIPFFPPHTTYVEPFGGAAGVLLQKSRVPCEVYNDLDGEIVGFFRVLQDPEQRARLIELLNMTPYARPEFDVAWGDSTDPVERARRIAIRAHMGFGSAGATKGSTGFRFAPDRAHTWAKYPSTITAIAHRFKGVIIENRPAIDVITAHDSSQTLHFVDPPYVLSTRVTAAKNSYYAHEMSDQEHRALIGVLRSLKGMVVLTGYENDIYADLLNDWLCHRKRVSISAQHGSAFRVETVWLNPACGTPTLFDNQ